MRVLRVRPANLADIPVMMELERASPFAAHWSRTQYENLSASAASPQSERLAFIAEKGSGADREGGSSEASEIQAFLVARRVGQEWELENIVVAERARRRGIATVLLRAFLTHVQANSGTSVFLEVRESNQGARGLYSKLGFKEAGVRAGYYANPPEDAILCRLVLG